MGVWVEQSVELTCDGCHKEIFDGDDAYCAACYDAAADTAAGEVVKRLQDLRWDLQVARVPLKLLDELDAIVERCKELGIEEPAHRPQKKLMLQATG